MLDYDKYLEIERRTDPEITKFEGLEDYRCIACELKKKKSESDAESNQSASPLLGSCASVKLPNFNPANPNTNSGYNPTTNSGYAPLSRARVAPRVAPSMPLPSTGRPNSVVDSSGVIAKTNRFPSPPPLKKGSFYYNTTEYKLYYCDGNSWIFVGGQSGSLTPPPPPHIEISVDTTLPTPTVQKTPPEIIKEQRIANRWWRKIFK
jgi:hypothetical protein